METAVIIDVIVAAVLLAFLIVGIRRGLFRSVAGLVVVLTALVGANLAANTLTPMAAGVIQPTIEKRVEEKLEAALDEKLPSEQTEDSSIGELLALLGMDDDPARDILESAKTKVADSGASVITAVAMSVAESTLHVALFLLVFAALLIALKLLVRLVDLTLKLPVLSTANALGGGAVGLVEGALALFLAVWVLRRFGVSFDTGAAADTVLLRFFTTNTPLGVLSLT